MRNTKLTLSISEQIISEAKKFAKVRGTSISFLVESYLKKLIAEQTSGDQTSSNISKLKGIITLPDDYDYKKELGNLYSK